MIEAAIGQGEKIEALSFDNDLGEGEKEGWEIAKWLSEEHPEVFEHIAVFNVHSANPTAAKRIENIFEIGRSRWRELVAAKHRPSPWGEVEIK